MWWRRSKGRPGECFGCGMGDQGCCFPGEDEDDSRPFQPVSAKITGGGVTWDSREL